MKNKLCFLFKIVCSALLFISCESKTLDGIWSKSKQVENGERIEINNNKILYYFGDQLNQYESDGTPKPNMEESIIINEKDSTITTLKTLVYEDNKTELFPSKKNAVKFHLVNEDKLIYGNSTYYRISKDKVDSYIEGEKIKKKQAEEDYKELKKTYKEQDYLYGVWEYSSNGVQAKYILNQNYEYTFYSNVGGFGNGTWSGSPDRISFQTEGGFTTGNGYITEDGELSVANMVFTKN